MIDATLIIATRTGDALGLDLWLPMLPSYQFPTITWTDGRTDAVARVTFPPEPERVQIQLQGDLDTEDRDFYLAHGWRMLPKDAVRPLSNPPDV